MYGVQGNRLYDADPSPPATPVAGSVVHVGTDCRPAIVFGKYSNHPVSIIYVRVMVPMISRAPGLTWGTLMPIEIADMEGWVQYGRGEFDWHWPEGVSWETPAAYAVGQVPSEEEVKTSDAESATAAADVGQTPDREKGKGHPKDTYVPLPFTKYRLCKRCQLIQTINPEQVCTRCEGKS